MENNTITPRPLQYNNSKRGIMNCIGWTSGMTPLERCKKELYNILMNCKIKRKISIWNFNQC
jgi:hypothetical protein